MPKPTYQHIETSDELTERRVCHPIREDVYTKVVALDSELDSGRGSACNHYMIKHAATPPDGMDSPSICYITFQRGPVKENEVNGIYNEDLLAIVRDRLQGFQQGRYACPENGLALRDLERAIHWLNQRTAKREQRGVEGTSQK